jgi:NitT/TauT family transport system ATP-binding protein
VSGLTAVGTQQGAITLENNSFFDGVAFDPHDIEGYMRRLP